MSNNIYDIMAKLNSITTEPKQDETQEETVYENLEPRGSLIKAVKSLASKYEDFVAEENKQIDETQFSDKETFDKLAEPGDTYKTADGGTVTKTEKGIKHSAPSGKYGAGPEDDKDELDENTSENTLEESQADIRNHPIYTNEEAWDHYQKELAEANAEQEETVDIQDELNELNRLAGLAEKVGGNKSHDFVDDVTHKKDEVEEESDPATYEKETYYEFTGDDGEQGSGYLYYTINVVDGKPVVDPKSLKATCNGDGNNKLTDEWCTQMVQPGGEEHQYALQAAQEEAEEEWNELDVPVAEGFDPDSFDGKITVPGLNNVPTTIKYTAEVDKEQNTVRVTSCSNNQYKEECQADAEAEWDARDADVPLDEGKMKDLMTDIDELTDEEFEEKYKTKKPDYPGINKKMDEGKMKELHLDMTELSDEEFEKKYQSKKSDWDEVKTPGLRQDPNTPAYIGKMKTFAGDLAAEANEEKDMEVYEGPTRKDFQMVADLLKDNPNMDDRKAKAKEYCDKFAKMNPRFDKERFLKACGVTEAIEEDDFEEGNEFSGALAQAKKDGKQEFEVDGKVYKVQEDELKAILRLAR